MGRKLNGCRNGRMCACGALSGDMAGICEKVPVPCTLAAAQDAPPLRHRTTRRYQLRHQQRKEVMALTVTISAAQPIDLGSFEDASPCQVLFARLHGIFGGTTGSGKSGGLNVLMGNLVACRDVVIWAIDLKKGMELGPWQSCIGRLATTPGQAMALLRDAVAVLEARAALLAAAGKRGWPISPDMPALIILIDEYAELADEAPHAMSDTDSIARLGRAVAVTLIAATQRPMSPTAASPYPPVPVRADEAEHLDLIGHVLLADSSATAGALSSHRVALGRGADGAVPHRHDNSSELFYILDGAFDLLAADNVVTAHTGDLLVVPPGAADAFAAQHDSTAEALIVATPSRLSAPA